MRIDVFLPRRYVKQRRTQAYSNRECRVHKLNRPITCKLDYHIEFLLGDSKHWLYVTEIDA
jgi:hypothetical protein